jgi:hypothetical protein
MRAVICHRFNELQLLAIGAGLADIFDLQPSAPWAGWPGIMLTAFLVSWLARELGEAAQLPNNPELIVGGISMILASWSWPVI